MKKYYADKTCRNILRVVALLVTVGLIYLVGYYLHPVPILMWILVIVFGAVYLVMGAVWLPLFLHSLMYYVSGDEVIVHSGVIYRNKMIMKTSAIRHITVITTPFSKATGLNFIILNAVGGNVIMSFLSWDDCEKIEKAVRP